MKISLICYFFDLIVNEAEIYKIRKWTQFSHEMLKIASVSGALTQTPLGELTTLPRPPSREGLLSFGTRSLTYSRVLISTPASRSEVSSLQAHGPCSILCTELTNYGYFCILCTHPIYVFGPSVIS